MTDAETFVRDSTVVGPVPFVPEIALHQSAEAIGLWELTEARSRTTGLPPPFWAFAWAGGQALARYLLDHREVVAGRRVLDVAAGSGLVAVAAMLAGAATATANDVDELAAAAVALNATANGVAVTPLLADLTGAGPVHAAVTAAEVVLAGDVFYDRHMAARMLPFLRAVAARGHVVLVGDPGRAYLPASGLVELARYDVPVIASLEDRDVRSTAVLRLVADASAEI